VIVDTQALKMLFLAVLFTLAYVWMCRPQRMWLLGLIAFIFRAAVTGHYPVVWERRRNMADGRRKP
jgi:hypothetical protein